jgi:hypothetical protein
MRSCFEIFLILFRAIHVTKLVTVYICDLDAPEDELKIVRNVSSITNCIYVYYFIIVFLHSMLIQQNGSKCESY